MFPAASASTAIRMIRAPELTITCSLNMISRTAAANPLPADERQLGANLVPLVAPALAAGRPASANGKTIRLATGPSAIPIRARSDVVRDADRVGDDAPAVGPRSRPRGPRRRGRSDGSRPCSRACRTPRAYPTRPASSTGYGGRAPAEEVSGERTPQREDDRHARWSRRRAGSRRLSEVPAARRRSRQGAGEHCSVGRNSVNETTKTPTRGRRPRRRGPGRDCATRRRNTGRRAGRRRRTHRSAGWPSVHTPSLPSSAVDVRKARKATYASVASRPGDAGRDRRDHRLLPVRGAARAMPRLAPRAPARRAR